MIAAVARHLLESSLFALIALLTVACLRHRSASSRHAILLCAVLKFAIPLQFLLSIGVWLRSELPARVVQVSVPPVFHRAIGLSGPVATAKTHSLLNIVFLSMWIVVAIVLLLVWLRRLFAPVDVSGAISYEAAAALERMRIRMRVARQVRLKASQGNLEPRLYGLLRPTIVLPEPLSRRLTDEELDAVLLHELAHVRRWDNLTRAFVHTVACVFWFFPVLLWLERRIDMECELACDELVLSSGARPQEYLDGILKVCQSYLLEPIAGSSSVSGSNLKRRMEFIMSFRMGKTNTRSASLVVGALVSGLAAVAIIAGFFTATSNRVRVLAASNSSKAPVSCIFGGKDPDGTGGKYPEGTVIQVGNGPEQMCVTLHGGQPYWIQISDQARARSQHVVSLPEPPPFVCTPGAPDGDYCTCKGHGSTSRGGKAVGPDHQVLTCGAHGQWMQVYTFTKAVKSR